MKPTKRGECDACPKTDVDLYPVRDMFLCLEHYQAEVKAIGDTKWIDNALKNGRITETPVELKQDIFNSVTAPFIHLQMVISADASIPQNKKNEVFMQRIEAHLKQLSDAIFAEEAALNEKKNERYAWSQQRREFIAKLQADEREKFKQYDVNYAPKAVTKKSVKSASTDKSPRKKGFDKKACQEAAKKYGVSWVTVQSIYIKKTGISYEAAAKQLAEMMGLIPETN